jgi:A/G-specific adenine glycosylase
MNPRSRSSSEGRPRANGRPRERVAGIAAAQRATFARSLLRWYDRSRRDLPWRRLQGDPYAVWLSEMMLQQTQVATVLRYFDQFLDSFPTIDSLAAAAHDDVMRRWAGLGYYARARNLHRAAKEIVSSHGGEIPRTVEGLVELPGVGRYTAGAVASIAFGAAAPVVDGNVARVLARCFGVAEDFKTPAGRATFWSLAESLLPARRCGDFNQALMELGATVCRPRSPACDACPLARRCVARLESRVAELPAAAPARPRRIARFLSIVVHSDDRILIRRRPTDGLWGGLWELPSVRVHGSERPRAALVAVLPDDLACRLGPLRRVGELTHELTHLRARFRLFGSTLRGRPIPDAANGFRWVCTTEFDGVGLGAVQRRLLDLHAATHI